MDMANLTQYIGRKVIRIGDGETGVITQLGNYDDDDDLEFMIKVDDGNSVVAEISEVLEGTVYKLL